MRSASGSAESDGDGRETHSLAGILVAAGALAALGLVALGGAVGGAFSSVARSDCDSRVFAREGYFLRLPESLPRLLWRRSRRGDAPPPPGADQDETPPLAHPAAIAIMSSFA